MGDGPRLQFHRGFTLRQGTELVDYLHDLGISHVYASPLLKANPGSTHGYDVCDCSQLNPELGTEADLETFVAALRQRGMGLVLDIVPNHTGIGPQNPWWWDVLKLGRSSKFADYFDIDWEGQPQQDSGVLVYPVLGRPFGEALEAGELTLEYDGAELVVDGGGHLAEDLLLRVEVVVEGAARRLQLVEEVLDAHLLVTLLRDQALGRVHERLPPDRVHRRVEGARHQPKG